MTDLFTRFDGRINRKTWWTGIVLLFVALLLISLVLGFLFGDGFLGRLLTLVISVGALYPVAALASKRLHDRGQPMMPKVAIFYGPGLLVTFLNTFNIGFRPMQLPGGEVVMAPGLIVSALGLVSLAAIIWAVVELGVLKGQPEANAYGPPPA